MIDVLEYKQNESGFLIGKLTIRVKKWGDFIIRDISLLKKGNATWLAFPSRKIEENGQAKYIPFVSFQDDKTMKKFQEVVLKSLDDYLKKNNSQNLL